MNRNDKMKLFQFMSRVALAMLEAVNTPEERTKRMKRTETKVCEERKDYVTRRY